jgi:hypothetical protein
MKALRDHGRREAITHCQTDPRKLLEMYGETLSSKMPLIRDCVQPMHRLVITLLHSPAYLDRDEWPLGMSACSGTRYVDRGSTDPLKHSVYHGPVFHILRSDCLSI